MVSLECDEVVPSHEAPVQNPSPETLSACGESLELVSVLERLDLMCRKEDRYMANENYIAKIQHNGMKESWRKKIALWFQQLATAFQLNPQTLHLAINLLDRYLSRKSCTSVRFQLASVASLFVASKLEEIRALTMDNFVALSDNLFDPNDVRLAEIELLSELAYQVQPPTVLSFAHLLLEYIKPEELRAELHRSVEFFLDKAMVEYAFVQFRPSTLAVAAIMCAIHRSSRRGVPGADVEALQGWLSSVQTLAPIGIQIDADVTACGRALLELDEDIVNPTRQAAHRRAHHAQACEGAKPAAAQQPPQPVTPSSAASDAAGSFDAGVPHGHSFDDGEERDAEVEAASTNAAVTPTAREPAAAREGASSVPEGLQEGPTPYTFRKEGPTPDTVTETDEACCDGAARDSARSPAQNLCDEPDERSTFESVTQEPTNFKSFDDPDPDKQFKSLAIGTGEPRAGADDGGSGDGSVKIERPEGTRPRGMSISHADDVVGPRKRCKTF